VATTEEISDPAVSKSHRAPSARSRWYWPLALVVAGLVLFVAYWREAWTSGVNSDGASNALQAWDMLHGNILLRGWTVTDISFYTVQLPELMVTEAVRGLTPSVLHITSALNYMLVVLGVAILARANQGGRAGAVRALLAAGVMLAPPLGATTTSMLHDPDHTAIQVLLLAVWFLLDWADRHDNTHWRIPAAVGVLLLWAQIADPITLYEGAAPLVLVCAIRMYRVREFRRREVYLVVASLIATGLADLVLKVIRHVGGFILLQPQSTFSPIRLLYQNVWGMIEDLLTLFGANFSGDQLGASAFIPLLHLVGFALAVWAIVRAFRGFGGRGLAIQVLAVTAVALLVSYMLRDQADSGPHEMVGVLVVGAVLAGRLLAEPLIRGRHLTVFTVVLVCLVGCLVYDASKPAVVQDPNTQLAAFLENHGLNSGLASYWQADSVTFASQDKITVTPVYRNQSGELVGLNRASKKEWFDPANYDARFVVISPKSLGCTGGSTGQWLATASKQFGTPANVYQVGEFQVLVYNQNLLTSLHEAAPGDPC
jgi:hypothetical protein